MKKISDKELLELIKLEYERIKPKGCWDFFKKRDRRIPSLPTLQKRFNKTYNEILLMAGVSDEDLNFIRRTPEQYLEKLKSVSIELGYVPSANEFNKRGYCSNILANHFGSYANAVNMLGLDCEPYKTPIKIHETKDELLKMYIDFSKKIGKPASVNDLMESEEIYDADIFYIRFGGMKGLKEKAGFPIIDKNNTEYSKEQIKRNLIELYLSYGRRLSVQELKANPKLPSYATILKYFETTKIEDIWNEIESEILEDDAVI